MGSNPHANGGLLRKDLRLPDFNSYAVTNVVPGQTTAENTRPLGALLRDTLAANPINFRLFGPDENTSNKLDAVYAVTKKCWMAEPCPTTATGPSLAPTAA
jgi:xylulose-5-phosphate/fructose-6-phosphate phosphoketolase